MINTKRMLLAFVVALVVVNVYDYLMFGMALTPLHAAHPRWLRPKAELPMLRMFLTGAFNVAVVTLFYALFARNRASGIATGVVFGVLLGLIAGWVPQATLKMLFNDYPFYTAWAPAIFGDFLLMGIVLGLVYRE